MMVDDLPRRHERQNGNRPPPPPFGRAQPLGDTIVVADNTSSSSSSSNNNNEQQQRTPGRSPQTVLSRSNYRATSFAPPPFVPPVLSRPDSSAHRNPPPPSRRPITHHAASSNPSGVTGGWRAHQIIRVSLQRPMGIVFAANEESGCGVRIVDMPPQSAAASSQQLLVGDVLISINGRDCTMSNSKEVMELIGQAGEGYIDLAFQRITVPTAAAAETNNNNNNAVASTKSTEDDDNDNSNDDDEGDNSHPETKLMQVTNLRWQDVTSGVNGRYDGTVNQNMRPHGRGRFTSDSGQGSFEGRWEDGVVTSLDTNNNEAAAAAASSNNNNNNIAAAAAAASIASATNNNDTLKRRRSAYTSSDAMSCVTRMNSSSFNMADYPDAQPYPNNGHDTNTTSTTGGGGGGAPQQQLQYYCLGETQRSSQHSIQSSSIEDIIQSVYALQISDFAFVRRSNGEWSFCQLVERNNNEEGEDVMTFVVNEVGHRKSLRPERWVKMVRACSSGVTIRGGGGVGGSLLSAPFSLSRSDSMERAPSF